MQVSVETTGTLSRRMKVALPPDRFEQEFSKRLKRLAGELRLPGFRPGKAPLNIVEAQYGSQLMQEIAGELIQSTFQEAVGQQGLKPAGGPRFVPQSLERGKEFEYIAEFEVYPEIAAPNLSGVKIERPICTVTDDDVTRTIDTLCKQRATWTPVTRAAQTGDRLVIDYKGSIDGTPFEGGTLTDYNIELGAGEMVAGFDEGLLGVTKDEVRKIKVTFPSGYHQSSLAGKAAEFEVTVKEISEPELPELDEAFISQFGIKDGGVETLRKEIMANLQRQKEQRIRALLKQRVFDALLEANPIEVPASLIQEEAERLRQITEASGTSRPTDNQTEEAIRQIETKASERRVRLGLILGEVIRQGAINVDPSKVRERIEEMATEYESPDEFIRWHYDNPKNLEKIQYMLVEEAAVSALLENADIIESPVDFKELVQPAG